MPIVFGSLPLHLTRLQRRSEYVAAIAGSGQEPLASRTGWYLELRRKVALGSCWRKSAKYLAVNPAYHSLSRFETDATLASSASALYNV